MDRPTVWERAKQDSGGFRPKRDVVVATVSGPVAFVLLQILGSPQGAMDSLVVAAIAAVIGGLVVPATERLWNVWQAPLRLLTDDVHALGAKLNEVTDELRQLAQAAPGPRVLAATERQEGQLRELRVAVARISEELELNVSVLADNNRTFFLEYQLAEPCWREHGSRLAEQGFADAHKAVRSAYRLIDDVNRSIDRDFGAIDGVVEAVAVRIDEAKSAEALEASRAALSALEAIPIDGTEI